MLTFSRCRVSASELLPASRNPSASEMGSKHLLARAVHVCRASRESRPAHVEHFTRAVTEQRKTEAN